MNKINIVKWLKACMWRRRKEDHIFEVVVYCDGRVVEHSEAMCTQTDKPLRFMAIHWASSILNLFFGNERRRLKGRA